jgi:hypothetical protein
MMSSQALRVATLAASRRVDDAVAERRRSRLERPFGCCGQRARVLRVVSRAAGCFELPVVAPSCEHGADHSSSR